MTSAKDLEAAIARLRGARPVHAPFTLEDWQALALVLAALTEAQNQEAYLDISLTNALNRLSKTQVKLAAAEARTESAEAALRVMVEHTDGWHAESCNAYGADDEDCQPAPPSPPNTTRRGTAMASEPNWDEALMRQNAYARGYAEGVKAALAQVRYVARDRQPENRMAVVVAVDEAEKALVKT